MTQPPKGHRWFAATYDALNRGQERQIFGPLRARLLSPLRGKVLEIGAGTGANLPYYSPDARVTGTEPDPHMLRRARRRAAALGLSSVELRLAGVEDLPFADGSFDHIVSTLVLCTVPDLPRALEEVRRVLKPGGTLHVIEHVRADGPLGKVQDIIRPAWSYFLAGCNPNRRTAQTLEAAGFRFEHLETKTLQFGIPFIIGSARLA